MRNKTSIPNPLGCVATAQQADLDVRLRIQGCFGGAEESLAARVRNGSIRIGPGDTAGSIRDSAELRALVSDLGARIVRREEPSQCTSTTGHVVELTWSCEGAGPSTLKFSTSDCGGRQDGVGGSTSGSSGPGRGYSRALAIDEVVRAAISPPAK